MKDFDYDFLADDESEDKETIEALKKVSRAKQKSFTAVINKRKLSRYELDELMA